MIIISQNHKIRALFGFRNDGSRSIFFWGKLCSNLGNCLIGSIGSAVDDIPINRRIHTLFGLVGVKLLVLATRPGKRMA